MRDRCPYVRRYFVDGQPHEGAPCGGRLRINQRHHLECQTCGREWDVRVASRDTFQLPKRPASN